MTATVVEFPAAQRRRRNYTGSETCMACGDSGQVVVEVEQRPIVRIVSGRAVATGETYDEELIGPCPRCEKGYRLEWGIGKRPDGSEYTSSNPPWGSDGYWQGRPIPDWIQ